MEKNVVVTDEFGNKLDYTYPKRARGLIKSGRARLVSENEIRLVRPTSLCPSNSDLEDFLMQNINNGENVQDIVNFVNQVDKELIFENVNEEVQKPKAIYFNAREWRFNPICNSNVGERAMITDMNGEINEAWCIGDWKRNWTEIQTESLTLEKNTDYVFTFWLNGGENDRHQETCQLQIIFDEDDDNRYNSKLNRSFIKPVKQYKGWVLFEIPFKTQSNGTTRLKFAVMDAHMAILPAKDKETYKLLPNEKIDPRIPQRHNIVFEDGFPRDSDWSYLVFGSGFTTKAKMMFDSWNNNGNDTCADDCDNEGFDFQKFKEKASDYATKSGETIGKFASETAEKATAFAKKAADYTGAKAKEIKHSAINSEFVRKHILNEIDFDEIKDLVEESVEDVVENIENEVNEETLEQLQEQIMSHLREEMLKEMDNMFK